jgi:hypothetical protein
MTTRVETPQSSCKVGFARADITPPVGCYHRMWGASLHEQSTGIHKPLLATALWIESLDGVNRQVIIGLDHCLLDPVEFKSIREHVAKVVEIPAKEVHVAMTHTHGSAWMSRSRSHLPGGEMIGPYLDKMTATCGEIAMEARQSSCDATIVYGTARCDLARHRDYPDLVSKQIVCGFNPDGPADDTVMLGKAVSTDGRILGTIVNYACHPTTLAWQNTLISPDYIGAMREVVEQETMAPCLFLQGSSGELGPKEGFVGDTTVADQNGRQLGFAALSGLAAIPKPGTHFEYAGPVISGAILGTWKHEPITAQFAEEAKVWAAKELKVDLHYRLELPTEAETREELKRWQIEEEVVSTERDSKRISDCHAKVEQMNRQLVRLAALTPGKAYPFPVSITRIGHAIWVFTPGELYQQFQIRLRKQFPKFAVIVSTITDDWQPGYVPPATSYGYGIYQEIIAATTPGSFEALTQTVCREIEKLLA